MVAVEARDELQHTLGRIEHGLRSDDPMIAVGDLQQLVVDVERDHLPDDQIGFIVKNVLPKFVQILLKFTDLDAEMASDVNKLLEAILRMSCAQLQQGRIDVVETVSRILTDNVPYYQAMGKDMLDHAELDTDDSTEDSHSLYDGSDGDGGTAGVGEITSSFDGLNSAYHRNVNTFNEHGGFSTILQCIRAAQPPLPLSAVRFMLRPILKVKGALKKRALAHFAVEVRSLVFELLLSMPNEQLKNEERKTVHETLRVVETLAQAAELPNAQLEFEQLMLDFGLKCLCSPFFDKRLAGLSEIKEVIHTCARKQEMAAQQARPIVGHAIDPSADVPVGAVAAAAPVQLHAAAGEVLAESWLTPAMMTEWLVRNQVLEEHIFGENIHVQIVKRCTDILRFLAAQGALTDGHVRLIWEVTRGKHESVAQAVYAVIVDLAPQLTAPQLGYLEACIHDIPRDEFDKPKLWMVRGFAWNAIGSAVNQSAPIERRRMYGLDLLWELAQDEAPVDAELRQQALGVLCDLVAWQPCHSHRFFFLERCMRTLQNGSSVPQALRVTSKILATFPQSEKGRASEETISHVIDGLDERYGLLANLLSELRHFHDRAAAAGVAAAAEGSAERRAHMVHVRERLDFLDFVLTNAFTVELTVAQLDVLWNCLVLGALCAEEADACCTWLDAAARRGVTLSADVMRHVFEGCFRTLEPFHAVRPACYSMYETCFVALNRHADRIVVDPSVLEDGVAPAATSEVPFQVVADELIGSGLLWQIALDVEDDAVGARAVRFHNKLHHQLSVARLGRRAEAKRAEYVRMCIEALSVAATALGQLGADAGGGGGGALADDETGRATAARAERALHTRRIRRCLSLLHAFVDEPRVGAPADAPAAQRHGSSVRGQRLQVVVQVISGTPPRHEVWMHSNESIGALRAKVWRVLGGESGGVDHPSMLRMIAAGKELKNNHATLADLKIVHLQTVHVMKRAPTQASPAKPQPLQPAQIVQQQPLIGPQPQPQPQPQPASMDVEDADAPEATSAKRFAGERDAMGGAAGAGMPAAAVDARPNGVHDAGPTLTPASTLVATPSNFDALFTLLGLDDEVSSLTWRLLMNLPTDTRMLGGLRAVREGAPTGQAPSGAPTGGAAGAEAADGAAAPWAALLDPSSSFKLLYALQVVDMLMQPNDADVESPLCLPVEAGATVSDGLALVSDVTQLSAWCDAFLARGGVTHMIHVLTSHGPALLDPCRGPQRKACVALLLKLLLQVITRPELAQAHASVLREFELSEHCVCMLDLDANDERREVRRVCFSSPLVDAMLELVLHIAREHSPGARGGAGAPCAEAPAAAAEAAALVQPAAAADSDAEITSCAMRLLVAIAVAGVQGADGLEPPPICRVDAPEGLQRALQQLVDGCLLKCDHTGLRWEVAAALCMLAHATSAPVAPAPPGADAPAPDAPDAERPFLPAVSAMLVSFLPQMSVAPGEQVVQYFTALNAVYELACSAGGAAGARLGEMRALLHAVVQQMQSLPIVEPRYPDGEDKALIGLLRLTTTIVRAFPDLKREHGLISVLFDFLFTIQLARRTEGGGHPPPRCKTPACREAALGCLVELARGSFENMMRLSGLLLPQHSGGESRAQWHYMPAVLEKSRSGYVGLKNLGATCYMNSLLQQFSMVPDFMRGMLSLRLDDALRPAAGAEEAEPSQQEVECMALLSQLQTMLCYLGASEKRFFDTSELCATYKDFDGQPINTSVQMDVDEFFSTLFDKLELALKRTPRGNLLKELFGGETVSQVIGKSDDCTHTSERDEVFFALQINVKNKRSVFEGLSAFVEGEMLDGDNKYHCDQCGKQVDALKRCCVKRLPRNLILHLKRFEFDFDLMKKFKVNDLCEVPMTIDMWPYTKEGLAELDDAPAAADERQRRAGSADGMGEDEDEDEENDLQDGGARRAARGSGAGADAGAGAGADADADADAGGARPAAAGQSGAPHPGYIFDLKGVLVHTGTADSGHYYSFIKERQPAHGRTSPRWFQFNDTLVEEFDEADIPRCTYGGHEPVTQWDPMQHKHVQRWQLKTHSAYMLFYERRDEAAAGAAAEPDAEPAPRAASADAAAAARADECELGGMPPEISDLVRRENVQFFHDRHIFDEAYFAFVFDVCALMLGLPTLDADGAAAPVAPLAPAGSGCGSPMDVSACAASPAEPPSPMSGAVPSPTRAALVERALQLGTTFFVETLAHAKDKRSVPRWVDLLQRGYAQSLPSCRWLMAQLATDTTWLKQMLLCCTIGEMRASFSALVLHVVRVLRPHELHLYEAEARALLAWEGAGAGARGGGGAADGADGAARAELGAHGADAGARERSCVLAMAERLLLLLREAHSHWRNLQQLFELLHEFATLGRAERQWLLAKHGIRLLLDFYLGDERSAEQQHRQKKSKMGDKLMVPNLGHMLELLSKLVRSCPPRAPTEADPTGGWDAVDGSAGAFCPPDAEGEPLAMPADDRQLLSQCDLVARLVRDDVTVHSVLVLVRYPCWRDMRASQQAIEWACNGVHASETDSLKPYFEVLNALLMLDDGLAHMRVPFALERLMRAISENLRFRGPTIACFRFLIAAQQGSAVVREWVVRQHEQYLPGWFLHPCDYVRANAQQLVCHLLQRTPLEDGEVGVVALEPASWGPDELVASSVFQTLMAVVTDAVNVARDAPSSVMTPRGTHRPSSAEDLFYHTWVFVHFLRAVDYCVREWGHVVIADLAKSFGRLWELYDALDALQVECDESKKVIFAIWAHALQVHPELVNFFTETARFERILATRVAQRSSAQHHEYNNEALPALYAVIHSALSKRPELVVALAAHGSFRWAIKVLLVDGMEGAHALHRHLLELARVCAGAVPAFRAQLVKLVLDSARLHMGADGAHASMVKLLHLSMCEHDDHALLFDSQGLAHLAMALHRVASAFVSGSPGAVGLVLHLLSLLNGALRVLNRMMNERRDVSIALEQFDPSAVASTACSLFTRDDPTRGEVHKGAAQLALLLSTVNHESARRMMMMMLMQRERGHFFSAVAAREGAVAAHALPAAAAGNVVLMRCLLTHHAPADARQLQAERPELYTALCDLELQLCYVNAQLAQSTEHEQTMMLVARYLTLLIAESSLFTQHQERFCTLLRQLYHSQPPLALAAMQEPAQRELLPLAVLHAIALNPACAAIEECAQLYRGVLGGIDADDMHVRQRLAEVAEALAQRAHTTAEPEPGVAQALEILVQAGQPAAGPMAPRVPEAGPAASAQQTGPPSAEAETPEQPAPACGGAGHSEEAPTEHGGEHARHAAPVEGASASATVRPP